eukprot:TRINITY_DN4550_c0_g1_i1.p1 TRINITY_DN4550_c0_g1~~TRINITY_DN4550_c0_g1_i1.p1  ORF type:complete len:228 (-),score=88.16 TRINITY_DN4550_c0_g1_i1:119-802(-)
MNYCIGVYRIEDLKRQLAQATENNNNNNNNNSAISPVITQIKHDHPEVESSKKIRGHHNNNNNNTTNPEPVQKTERTVKIIEADDSQFKEKEDLEWGEKYKREKRDRQRMEQLVFTHEETIEGLKQKLNARDRKQKLLETKLSKEEEKRQALLESNQQYELKLRELEDELTEALNKEGERRVEAEYWQDTMKRKAAKWKKKYVQLEKKYKEKTGAKNEEESEDSEED